MLKTDSVVKMGRIFDEMRKNIPGLWNENYPKYQNKSYTIHSFKTNVNGGEEQNWMQFFEVGRLRYNVIHGAYRAHGRFLMLVHSSEDPSLYSLYEMNIQFDFNQLWDNKRYHPIIKLKHKKSSRVTQQGNSFRYTKTKQRVPEGQIIDRIQKDPVNKRLTAYEISALELRREINDVFRKLQK